MSVGFVAAPSRRLYDVVIVGGGVIGAAIAWSLARDEAFDGSVLVVERDPSYAFAATSRTNSCMRQQFSSAINIEISRYGAEYVTSLPERMAGVVDAPALQIDAFGYLYLATDDAAAERLRAAQALQASLGAGTRIMDRDALIRAFPFYDASDVVAASHNPIDEGYFEGAALFEAWRKGARRLGVEFVSDEAIDVALDQERVAAVELRAGGKIHAGALVNAAGTRAASFARRAGIALPIEPRKRYTWVFDAAEPLDRRLPLTVDPAGFHVRSDGASYMCGGAPEDDRAVDVEDFAFDDELFERKIWPAMAARIPAFERIRVRHAWVGHYDFNTLDQNAVLGAHTTLENYFFATGFSGHGLQQAPAIGRGLAERIAHGRYLTLDLSPLDYARIAENRPILERAII